MENPWPCPHRELAGAVGGAEEGTKGEGKGGSGLGSRMGLLQKMGSMAHSELHSHGDAFGLGRVEPANGVWTNAQSSVSYTRMPPSFSPSCSCSVQHGNGTARWARGKVCTPHVIHRISIRLTQGADPSGNARAEMEHAMEEGAKSALSAASRAEHALEAGARSALGAVSHAVSDAIHGHKDEKPKEAPQQNVSKDGENNAEMMQMEGDHEMSQPQPAIFISMGSPALLIETSEAHAFFRELGMRYNYKERKPACIVCVSARWVLPLNINEFVQHLSARSDIRCNMLHMAGLSRLVVCFEYVSCVLCLLSRVLCLVFCVCFCVLCLVSVSVSVSCVCIRVRVCKWKNFQDITSRKLEPSERNSSPCP